MLRSEGISNPPRIQTPARCGSPCAYVELFTRFVGRSPVDATGEDVRRYLIAEIDRGMSRSYCVIQRNAIRHLFDQTLGRPEELKAVPRPKRERRLPVVLSREEVRQLFSVIENIKHSHTWVDIVGTGLGHVMVSQTLSERS